MVAFDTSFYASERGVAASSLVEAMSDDGDGASFSAMKRRRIVVTTSDRPRKEKRKRKRERGLDDL